MSKLAEAKHRCIERLKKEGIDPIEFFNKLADIPDWHLLAIGMGDFRCGHATICEVDIGLVSMDSFIYRSKQGASNDE